MVWPPWCSVCRAGEDLVEVPIAYEPSRAENVCRPCLIERMERAAHLADFVRDLAADTGDWYVHRQFCPPCARGSAVATRSSLRAACPSWGAWGGPVPKEEEAAIAAILAPIKQGER
jgi:hypothetical protein